MRQIIPFVLLLFTLGCGEKLIDPPEDLIPPEQMTDILYDISIMDAIESNYPNALKRNDIQVMEVIFRKYGVDSARFVQSDLYYASQPNIYEEIYQNLLDRIQAQRDSITEVMKEGQRDKEKEEPDAERTPEGQAIKD